MMLLATAAPKCLAGMGLFGWGGGSVFKVELDLLRA